MSVITLINWEKLPLTSVPSYVQCSCSIIICIARTSRTTSELLFRNCKKKASYNSSCFSHNAAGVSFNLTEKSLPGQRTNITLWVRLTYWHWRCVNYKNCQLTTRPMKAVRSTDSKVAVTSDKENAAHIHFINITLFVLVIALFMYPTRTEASGLLIIR